MEDKQLLFIFQPSLKTSGALGILGQKVALMQFVLIFDPAKMSKPTVQVIFRHEISASTPQVPIIPGNSTLKVGATVIGGEETGFEFSVDMSKLSKSSNQPESDAGGSGAEERDNVAAGGDADVVGVGNAAAGDIESGSDADVRADEGDGVEPRAEGAEHGERPKQPVTAGHTFFKQTHRRGEVSVPYRSPAQATVGYESVEVNKFDIGSMTGPRMLWTALQLVAEKAATALVGTAVGAATRSVFCGQAAGLVAEPRIRSLLSPMSPPDKLDVYYNEQLGVVDLNPEGFASLGSLGEDQGSDWNFTINAYFRLQQSKANSEGTASHGLLREESVHTQIDSTAARLEVVERKLRKSTDNVARMAGAKDMAKDLADDNNRSLDRMKSLLSERKEKAGQDMEFLERDPDFVNATQQLRSAEAEYDDLSNRWMQARGRGRDSQEADARQEGTVSARDVGAAARRVKQAEAVVGEEADKRNLAELRAVRDLSSAHPDLAAPFSEAKERARASQERYESCVEELNDLEKTHDILVQRRDELQVQQRAQEKEWKLMKDSGLVQARPNYAGPSDASETGNGQPAAENGRPEDGNDEPTNEEKRLEEVRKTRAARYETSIRTSVDVEGKRFPTMEYLGGDAIAPEATDDAAEEERRDSGEEEAPAVPPGAAQEGPR